MDAEWARTTCTRVGPVLVLKAWVSDAAAEAHMQRQSLKFSLTADDMVGPCLFLASNAAGAIRAQSLIVDGGFL